MEFDPIETGAAPREAAVEDAVVSALLHHHRNQVQTMTSLVGLFGRRMRGEEGRKAFQDLRVRFEALTFASTDSDAAAVTSIDLTELVRRAAATLDEAGAHRIDVTGEALAVSASRGATLAQLVVELLIDLRRSGFGDDVGCVGQVSIDASEDGGVRLTARRTDGRSSPGAAGDDLGRTLADALASSLGGRVVREVSGGYACEASIPPDRTAR